METPPIDLDAQQQAIEEAEREKAKQRELQIADFRWLMQDERGRRFVWRLMRDGGVFHSSYSESALEMARKEGMREQGLRLLNEVLEVCPEHWLNMVKDQKRR